MSKFDDALQRLKDGLTNPLSKIEGSFSMFNLRPVAQQFALERNYVEIVENNFSLDTAKGTYLDEKAKDYGMYRLLESNSLGSVTFTGTDGVTIPAGTIVRATDYGVDFETRNDTTISDGSVTVEAQCISYGVIGNVPAGAIDSIPTQIAGVVGVTNNGDFTGGSEREDDDNFRLRILFKIRYPLTSGNVYDYQNWATSITGVGKVKVFPLWNGPGTVKVSILDANGDTATEELIEEVQNYIDPDPQQHGGGQAPIGALVTVTTASKKVVNVSAIVELGASATGGIEAIKDAFTEALKEDFRNKAYDGETDGISPALVGYVLLNVTGVLDYGNLLLNGGQSSISITDEEVLSVGTVELTDVNAGG